MDAPVQEGATGASAGAGVQVEIIQGVIENQLVDVIVSPMVGHDPVSTRIGKTLNNMTAELKAKFNKEAGEATLPSETVVIEGLPGLKCKAVIFLNLLCWDNNQHGTAVQALRRGIKKILATCNIRAYCSVALPVLGTGALLRFPHNITSTILLEEIGIYGQNRTSRSPFLVRIIVHPKDKQSSQAFQSSQSVLHQRGFISNVDPDQGSFYKCISITNDEITAMMGKVKLQILCGNIINAGTDVIVNTTNFTDLSFGVSKAILKAAGPSVLGELKKVGIPADYICSTAAGQLGCKEIIHASFKGKTQRIRNTCQKVLQLCESKRFGSVAFPAVNTGQAGMDAGEACKAMLDGMASAIREINPNSLSLIRIVILLKPVFQAFRSEVESRCEQDVQGCFTLKGMAKRPMEKILEMFLGISMSPSPQDQTFLLPNPGPTELQGGLNVTKTTGDLNRTFLQELSEENDNEKLMLTVSTEWAIIDANGELRDLCLLNKEALLDKEDVDMVTQDNRMFKVNLKAGEATECLTGKTYKLKNMATETGCVTSALALKLPPHWEPMNGEVFTKVELQPNSPEYQEVAKGFNTNYHIHKIERVQNVFLWHAFSVCRYRILSKNGDAELGEKLLYHGTSAASCNTIERDRFDRSYAGKHAAIYGKGVYFSVNASYSADKYSPEDESGLRRLYVARVLTGRHTVGNPSMKAPPPRGADATDCFDSLVNNQHQPTIFVIFHDDQAYPEYLITFS